MTRRCPCTAAGVLLLGGGCGRGRPAIVPASPAAPPDGANLAPMPAADASTKTLLGGRTPAAFLRRYWQKDALLVRDALRDFTGLFTRDSLFRAGPARRCRIPARRARRHPLVARPRPVPPCRLEGAAANALDAARAGGQPPFRRRRCTVAPVRIPAVRAPGRLDGELCRARRRRRSAFRFLRRVPAAGSRPPSLALRPAGGPVAQARAARQDPAPVHTAT